MCAKIYILGAQTLFLVRLFLLTWHLVLIIANEEIFSRQRWYTIRKKVFILQEIKRSMRCRFK